MNSSQTSLSNFLAEAGSLVDVRSPSEFQRGHIPGSVNLPLFTDPERAEIGTLYAQQGRHFAVEAGVQMAAARIGHLSSSLRELSQNCSHPFRLYCWRGGMRSQSVAWFAGLLGLPSIRLAGGYKSYRRAALACFQQPWEFITLSGLTGAGKTSILHQLKLAGEQILDLEGLANHRGSAFGAIGLPPQPANQLFENYIFEALSKLDPGRRVWVEDEARAIGKVRVPQDIWATMRQAPVLFIDVPLKQRVQNLLDVYGGFDHGCLARAIGQIHKRFGPGKTEAALAALGQGDLESVTRLTLGYYDQAYSKSASRRESKNVFRVELAKEANPDEVVSRLVGAAENLGSLEFCQMREVLVRLEKASLTT